MIQDRTVAPTGARRGFSYRSAEPEAAARMAGSFMASAAKIVINKSSHRHQWPLFRASRGGTPLRPFTDRLQILPGRRRLPMARPTAPRCPAGWDARLHAFRLLPQHPAALQAVPDVMHVVTVRFHSGQHQVAGRPLSEPPDSAPGGGSGQGAANDPEFTAPALAEVALIRMERLAARSVMPCRPGRTWLRSSPRPSVFQTIEGRTDSPRSPAWQCPRRLRSWTHRAFSAAPKGRSGPIRHPVDPREFCAPSPMRRLGRPQRVLQLRGSRQHQQQRSAGTTQLVAGVQQQSARPCPKHVGLVDDHQGWGAGGPRGQRLGYAPAIIGSSGKGQPEAQDGRTPSALHDPFSPRLRRQQPGECVRVAPAVPGVDSHGHPNAGLVGGEILKPERQGRLAVASGPYRMMFWGMFALPRSSFPSSSAAASAKIRCSRLAQPKTGGGRLRPGGKAHREWASGLLGGCSCASLLRRPIIVWGRGFLSNERGIRSWLLPPNSTSRRSPRAPRIPRG